MTDKDASGLVERLGALRDAVQALPEDTPNIELIADIAEAAAEFGAIAASQAEEINAGLEREKALVDDYNDALAEIERLRAALQAIVAECLDVGSASYVHEPILAQAVAVLNGAKP